ncbi:MAG: TRAP transporter small permease subunit [Synergistetes bacterium]|nr:TRAP transporter small permease subunit [Synergistota bacterium]MCX8127518.1 TRAP transporter small permease subunit [Synergistota bacterium]MDW8191565.1 TRAP transporter small permease subunit [Synergistota bacterium]
MGLFIWKFLEKAEQTILVIVSLVVTFLVMAEVILRYVFARPLMGIEELATLVGCWLYFIGSAHASRERSHIMADVLNVIVKTPRNFLKIKFVITIFTFIMTIIFLQWSWNYIKWALKVPEYTPSLRIPLVYAQVAMLISAILMVFYTFVEIVDYTLQLLGKREIRFKKEEELSPEIEKS